MLHVLIIDDEESIRSSLSIHLGQLGYTVETAEHPLDCICVLTGTCQDDAPYADVIISDQYMPHMTGLEFMANRSERGCKGAKQHLAIMSANISDDERQRAVELGCRIFIKPFKLEEIEQWLDEIQQERLGTSDE